MSSCAPYTYRVTVQRILRDGTHETVDTYQARHDGVPLSERRRAFDVLADAIELSIGDRRTVTIPLTPAALVVLREQHRMARTVRCNGVVLAWGERYGSPWRLRLVADTTDPRLLQEPL